MFIKIKHIALFTVAFAVFGCSTDFTTNSDSGSFVEFAGLGAVDENDDGSLLLTWNPATAFSQFQYKIYFQEADNVDTSTMTPVGTVGARPVFRENFKTGEKTPFANGQLIATLSSDTTEFRLDNLLNSSKYYIVQVKVDLGDGKIDENHLVQVVGPRGDLTYKGCSVVEPGDNLGEIKIQVDVPLQASIVQILRDGTPIASSINNGVSTIVDRGLEDLSRDYTYLCVASVGDQTWLGEPSFSKPFNPLIGYEGCVSGKPLGSNVAQIDFDFPSLASGVKLYRNGVLAGAKTAASAPNEVGGIGKFVDTSLSEGITYQYECAATIGEYEIRGTKDQLITTLSSNPPTFSGIDSATYLTPKSAKLKWPVATGVIATSYKIYAQTGLAINPATPIATIEASTLEYEVTNLGDDLTYSFSVRACSDQGVCDNNIETITPTRETPNIDAGAPTSPGLTEAKLVNGQIKLTIPWEDSYGGVAKRNVYVFEGTTAGSNISQYSLSQTIAVPDPLNPPTEFLLSGINEGQQYQIIVRDEDVHGNINQNTVFQTVAVNDITAPSFAGISNLSKGTPGNEDSEITLSFKTIALEGVDPSGANSYHVFWKQGVANACDNFDFEKSIEASTLAANTDIQTTINNLNPKTVYSFCVKASDSAGNLSGNINFLYRSTFDLITPDFDGAQSLSFISEQQLFRIAWNPSTSSDIFEYIGEIWNQKTPSSRLEFRVSTSLTSNIDFTDVARDSGILNIETGDTLMVVVNACDNAHQLLNTLDAPQNCTLFSDSDAKSLTVADVEPPPGFDGISDLQPNSVSLTATSQETKLDVSWTVSGGDWSDYGGFQIYLIDGAKELSSITNAELLDPLLTPVFTCTVGSNDCDGGSLTPTNYQIFSSQVKPNRLYHVHVRAFDKQVPANFTILNIEAQSRTVTTADISVPAFTTITAATYNETLSAIELNWTQEATDNQDSGDLTYLICRRTGTQFDLAAANACTPLHSVTDETPNDTSDTVSFINSLGLESNTTYYYAICVEDASSNRACNPNFTRETLPDIAPPAITNFTSDKTDTSKTWNLTWELSDAPNTDITHLSVQLFRGYSDIRPISYQASDIVDLSLEAVSVDNSNNTTKLTTTDTGRLNKREWINYILRVDDGINLSYATYSVLSDNEIIAYQIRRVDGSPLGGETLVIRGKGFAPGTLVDIGINPCENIEVHGSTVLTCTAPAGTLGAVDVNLTNPDGSSSQLANAYTYTNNSTNPCDLNPSGSLFHSGSGGENDPYIICNLDHFQNVTQVGNLQHFEIWENLDFSGVTRGCTTLRNGTHIDGKGHAIVNFGGSSCGGVSASLFTSYSNGGFDIRNIGMVNFDVRSGRPSALLFAADSNGCEEDSAQNYLENLYFQGNLTITQDAGTQFESGAIIGRSTNGGFILKAGINQPPNTFEISMMSTASTTTVTRSGGLFGRIACGTIHDTDVYIDMSSGPNNNQLRDVGGVGGVIASNSDGVITDFKNIRVFGNINGNLSGRSGGLIGLVDETQSSENAGIYRRDFENIENHVNINSSAAVASISFRIGGVFGFTRGIGVRKNLSNFGKISTSFAGYSTMTIGGISGEASGRYNYTSETGTEVINDTAVFENTQNYGEIISFATSLNAFQNFHDFRFSNAVGGIIGGGSNILVKKSQNFGRISGNDSVGGLTGRIEGSYDGTTTPLTSGVNNSMNYGTVNGVSSSSNYAVGGLIGTINVPTYAISDNNPLRFETHEIAIQNSHNFGNISNNQVGGGLIGNNYKFDTGNFPQSFEQAIDLTVTVENSSFNPTETNTENSTDIRISTGGIIGSLAYGNFEIKNSFVRANFGDTLRAGGLIGETVATSDNVIITNSYAATTFVGGSSLGGITANGAIGGNYTVLNTYWDTSISGIDTTFQGAGNDLTTSQMLDINNYISWDFINIWEEVTGSYPGLR